MSWIRRISCLSVPEKEGLYRILIPPAVFHGFGIDPLRMCNEKGQRLVRFFSPPGDRTCLVEVRLPDSRLPLYSLQISDTPDFTQLDWDFLIVNDPSSPAFGTNVDCEGRDTLFGWASRNLVEEEKALLAGYFPGQVGGGLRLTGAVIRVLEFFCSLLDIKTIRLEALFYHNAIIYERHGFGYLEGYACMKRIHECFQPGGALFDALDNSTPFRKPEFAHTVRGRSWAIHDGILEEASDDLLSDGWASPVMYRMVERPRAMVTFPDPVY